VATIGEGAFLVREEGVGNPTERKNCQLQNFSRDGKRKKDVGGKKNQPGWA